VLIPTNPDGPTIEEVLRVVEFEFVTKILVAEIELVVETLPRTVTFAPTPVEVLMPMRAEIEGTFNVVRFEPPEKIFPTGAEIEPIMASWSVVDPKFETK
jgi:hypothetical protein